MKAIQIESGRVKNIILVDDLNAMSNLVDWALHPYVQIGDTWDGAAFTTPAPDPAVVAEQERLGAIETEISNDTLIASLKAMTNAEFNSWWDANVTTAAQAIGVLKRLARIVIRRAL